MKVLECDENDESITIFYMTSSSFGQPKSKKFSTITILKKNHGKPLTSLKEVLVWYLGDLY